MGSKTMVRESHICQTTADAGYPPELLAAQELEEAARFLDLERWITQRLHHCERETQVNLQITRGTGGPLMARATRVQYALGRGPCMGPLIFSPRIGEADLRVAAMRLSWQWALWGLPLSGSAGVISVSTDELSERELKSLVRQYTEKLDGVLGPNRDVMMPSSEVPAQVMGWIASTVGGEGLPGAVGKPAEMFGLNTHAISGRFVRALARAALREQGLKLAGASVVLVGFDAEAREIATALDRAGANVVGVSDRSGAVCDRAGLNVGVLLQHVASQEVIFGFRDAQAIEAAELVRMPCDVLILTSGEQWQVSPAAKLVLEVNGSMAADVKQTKRLPRMLAGFGPPLAAFAEWRRNAHADYCEADCVRGLDAYVAKTWREVSRYAKEHEVTFERATLILGIARIASRMRASQ